VKSYCDHDLSTESAYSKFWTDKQLTKDQLVALCDKLQYTAEFKATNGKGFKNVTRDLQVFFLMKKLKTDA
jgi:hypothetical protein